MGIKTEEYVVRMWQGNGTYHDLPMHSEDNARAVAQIVSKDGGAQPESDIVEVLQICTDGKGSRDTLWKASYEDGKNVNPRNEP